MSREFDPYEEADKAAEKILQGVRFPNQQGGNMNWIDTDEPGLQREFINELQRLLGPRYKIRVVKGCYYSVEDLQGKKAQATQTNTSTTNSSRESAISDDEEER